MRVRENNSITLINKLETIIIEQLRVLILPKKVTEEQKENICESFSNGININELSNLYGFSVSTITKQLKSRLGIEKFKKLKKDFANKISISQEEVPLIYSSNQYNENLSGKVDYSNLDNKLKHQENYNNEEFLEIVPLTSEINLENQKDLSSIPLDEVEFPKMIYIIVDNKIELIIKLLRDYPEWGFLSEEDLNRKTIQIYFELKNAKSNCQKDQKVIKVPNTNLFKIVSPILLSRGISRIITEDKIISL